MDENRVVSGSRRFGVRRQLCSQTRMIMSGLLPSLKAGFCVRAIARRARRRRAQLPGGARDSRAVCGGSPQTPGDGFLNGVQIWKHTDFESLWICPCATTYFPRVAGNRTRVACSTRESRLAGQCDFVAIALAFAGEGKAPPNCFVEPTRSSGDLEGGKAGKERRQR